MSVSTSSHRFPFQFLVVPQYYFWGGLFNYLRPKLRCLQKLKETRDYLGIVYYGRVQVHVGVGSSGARGGGEEAKPLDKVRYKRKKNEPGSLCVGWLYGSLVLRGALHIVKPQCSSSSILRRGFSESASRRRISAVSQVRLIKLTMPKAR